MPTRKPGGRYVRNRVTGAVFHYNERIASLADMEEMEADAEGNLVKLQTRAPVAAKLTPTRTPEKVDEPAAATSAKTEPAKPTLAPVAPDK
jgi:hypothetical protein